MKMYESKLVWKNKQIWCTVKRAIKMIEAYKLKLSENNEPDMVVEQEKPAKKRKY